MRSILSKLHWSDFHSMLKLSCRAAINRELDWFVCLSGWGNTEFGNRAVLKVSSQLFSLCGCRRKSVHEVYGRSATVANFTWVL